MTIVISFCACPIERMFGSDQTADGVARLTVANLGLLLMGIRQEKHETPACSFLSDKPAPVAEHLSRPKGKISTIVWSFNKCEYDFGEETKVFEEDGSVAGVLSGKVVVSGKKTIHGFLTGNPDFPIIPEGANSFNFTFSKIDYDNFSAYISSVKKYLKIIRGRLSAGVQIHLGRSKSLGLCSKIVPNLTFQNVKYNPDQEQDVLAELPGIFNIPFQVIIRNSDFNAQQNAHETAENTLEGRISVWGFPEKKIPTDKKGLDPSFDINNFLKQLENYDDLSYPLSFQCPVDEFLVVQSSRLLIQNLGNIATEFGSDPYCGPRSAWMPEEIPENTWKISSNDCVVGNDEPKQIVLDCRGTRTFTLGKAQVTGDTLIKGIRPFPSYLSNIERKEPENLTFAFSKVVLDNYVSYDIEPENDHPKFKLLVYEGTLSGEVHPVFAEELHSPCTFTAATPIANLKNVRLKDARTRLTLNLKNIIGPDDLFIEFDIDIKETILRAQNGYFLGIGNFIYGTVELESGRRYELKGQALNPFYSQHNFDESYRCKVYQTLSTEFGEDPAYGCVK